MTIQVLIVDDERLARARISNYLRVKHPDWLIREAMDGPDALALIAEQRPEIIFLDVEMPEMNGFEVVQNLGDNPPKIIFQTAYDQYAVKAFDACACDYLLKPFTDERLETALNKALHPAPNAVIGLQSRLVADHRYMKTFVVSAGNRRKIISESDILYFISSDHVTRIFLQSQIDYAYEFSLSYLEPKIDPEIFLRVHRNSIVRISEIASIERGANMQITLKTGAVLPVSRERRKALLARFG